MKKNIMMRVASIMLIAVLLSTCTISGTFAKYVTTENAEDEARVAAFGVTITATGVLFGEQYTDEIVEADASIITVQAVNFANAVDNVVAPGTQNTTGLTFAVAGAPEVKVKVDIVVEDVLDIFLAEGVYDNTTTGNLSDTFENEDMYYPVQFTLMQTLKNEEGEELEPSDLLEGTDRTLADVKDALEDLTRVVEANTDLETKIGTLKLTWTWEFGDEAGITGNDKQDTLLGDLAAGKEVSKYVAAEAEEGEEGEEGEEELVAADVEENKDYCLDTSIKITITVTQIN